MNLKASMQRCLRYRRRILEISQAVSALHIAPAFSCLEITDVIYHEIMQKDLYDGKYIDTFLMSKGHGCLAQYVILEDINILSSEEIALYCKPNGSLGAHPDYGVPGIAASTGSLGHGLGIAVGIAYADKLMNKNSKTYVLISDGELQEGSTWEAIMMAANLKLDNLIVFVDLNDFGSLARMSEGHPAFYPVLDKLTAFGWSALEINGHSSLEIFQSANNYDFNKPLCLICKTIKGKGVSYMENVSIWHYRSPNHIEYLEALDKLVEISE